MLPDFSLAQEYKGRVIGAFNGRVAKVVLYGSRARGHARPDPDWDIAVFLTDDATSDDLDPAVRSWDRRFDEDTLTVAHARRAREDAVALVAFCERPTDAA